jgi:outer membrane protein assembly factor BamB
LNHQETTEQILKLTVKKVIFGVVITVLLSTVLTGCFGGSSPARGWAGATKINNTLIFTKISGDIYSVDAATGATLGSPVKLVVTSSGGFLSCGPSTAPIAVYSSPIVSQDLVIIPGYSTGRIYAYPLFENRLSTSRKWSYPQDTSLSSNIVGGLALGNGRVYFSTVEGVVYALDAATGAEVWSHEVGEQIWSSPAVSGDTVYLTTFDKKLHALNTTNGTEKWVFETRGAISAPPVVQDGIVYVGDYDRRIYAVKADNGQALWTFPGDNPGTDIPSNWFWTAPLISGDNLYAACLDGKVYVLNKNTGSLITSVDVQDSIASAPVFSNGSLVVASTNLAKSTSKVYAIDTASFAVSELTGFSEGIDAPLFVDGSNVYVHTTSDNFYSINVETKATLKINLTSN